MTESQDEDHNTASPPKKEDNEGLLYEYSFKILALWLGLTERQERKAQITIGILGLLSGATMLSMPGNIQGEEWPIVLPMLHIIILAVAIVTLVLCIRSLVLSEYLLPDDLPKLIQDFGAKPTQELHSIISDSISEALVQIKMRHERKAKWLKRAINYCIPTLAVLIMSHVILRTIYHIEYPQEPHIESQVMSNAQSSDSSNDSSTDKPAPQPVVKPTINTGSTHSDSGRDTIIVTIPIPIEKK